MKDRSDLYNYRSRPIPGQELRAAILTAIKARRHPSTRLEICRCLNRKKSPHIINEIKDMARDGLLVEQTVKYGGSFAYVYSLKVLP